MKLKQKLTWVAVLLLGLFSLALLSHGVLAQSTGTGANLSDAQACANSIRFTDVAHVQCKDSHGAVHVFLDRDPTDSDPTCRAVVANTCYHNKHYQPQDNFFCDPGKIEAPNAAANHLAYRFGITADPDNNSDGPLDPSLAGKEVNMRFNIGYNPASSTECARYGGANQNHVISGSATQKIAVAYSYQGDGSTIDPPAGVNDGKLNKHFTLINYDTGNPNLKVYASDDYLNCKGDLMVVNFGKNNSTIYTLKKGNGVDAAMLKKYPVAAQFLVDQHATGCEISGIEGSDVVIAGKPPVSATGSTTPGSSVGLNGNCTGGAGCNSSGLCSNPSAGCSGNVVASGTCESKSVGFPLRWLFCPLLSGANAAAEQLRQTFEQQLSFTLHDPNNPTHSAGCTTASSSGAAGATGAAAATSTCGSGLKDQGLARVKSAWSVIRLMASSLIIIIMLIMVLSEAMGGPFDAYTVRKVLPRLVVAVILMQISWSIFIWAVDAVDDLGRSIDAIMYKPFGGSAVMNLWDLMRQAGIGDGTLDVVGWIGLIGVVIAAAVALPTVLLMCTVGLFALLTAVIVLIFRKIIIIAGLIFAPLALLFWILPGTKSYWDYYFKNLTKALFMFPIVVAIIAAGRIFASVATTSGNGLLINFFLVLVGFFGPLFVLPKCFQWGGQLMSATGNMVSKMNQPIAKGLGGEAKGWGERAVTGRFAKRYTPIDGRFKRTAFSILGGRYLPTKYQQATLEQRGDTWNDERKKEALANVNRKADTARARGITGYKWNADTKSYEARQLNDVAGYKQAFVEASINGEAREKEMAITRLDQTQSWPEVQGNYAMDKATGEMKRVFDSSEWSKTYITNEQIYPDLLRKRYDLVPHIKDQTYTEKNLADFGYTHVGGGVYRDVDGREARAGEAISSADRLMLAAKDYMAPADFSSQAQGFWDEAAMVGGTKIATVIAERLKEVADTGNYGITVLGAMRGGEQGAQVAKVVKAGGADLAELIKHAQLMAQDPSRTPMTTAGGAGGDTGGGPPPPRPTRTPPIS